MAESAIKQFQDRNRTPLNPIPRTHQQLFRAIVATLHFMAAPTFWLAGIALYGLAIYHLLPLQTWADFYNVIPLLLMAAACFGGAWCFSQRAAFTPWWLGWATGALFSLLIPGGGLILLVTVPGMLFTKKRERVYWETLPAINNRYQPSRHRIKPRFGGDLAGLLLAASEQQRRTEVIQILEDLPEKQVVNLLHVALRDATETNRLLAFKLLEQRMQRYLSAIETETRSAKNGRPETVGYHHLHVAYLNWELIYQELVPQALVPVCLNIMRDNLARYPEAAMDADAGLLLARAALLEGKLEEASQYLDQLENTAFTPAELAIYRAELAFQQGSYDQVKGYLNTLQYEETSDALLLLKQSWEGSHAC